MVRGAAGWLGCVGLVVAWLASGGCSRETGQYREYPVKGQILSVGQVRSDGRREVSLQHDDIPGFMPAMTMAYFVRKPALLDGLAAGDLVTATLVLHGSDMYLDRLTRIGHTDLPVGAKPVKAMDVMDAGDTVPDDELRDQDGQPRKLSDWRGRALAVTFVYTRCPLPDFCPLMDRHFAELQRALTSDPRLRDRAHLVSVTFDPAHDTPAVIAAHARARGADPETWSYLTGAPDVIEHFTARFGVSAMRDADAAQTITHNLRTAVVDRRGRLVTVYSGNDWRVDQLLADLRDAAAR